jgi:hypothetical protein
MIFQTFALVGLTFIAATFVATAYERRQDVLYGPYIYGRARTFDLLLSITMPAITDGFSSLRWRARDVMYLTSVIAI